MRQLYEKIKSQIGALQWRVNYVRTFPSAQNAVDLFRGEWASEMPSASVNTGGFFRAFDDPRISESLGILGGVAGKCVVELGPMEAGHSLMMERMGAESILGIESNPRAYLKCLVTKEINELRRCRFLLGDFVEYMRKADEKFDICIASGVLYHMTNPAELLFLISRISDNAMIWTHYYDEAEIRQSGRNLNRITKPESLEFNGFKYSAYRQHYGKSLFGRGFCGGPNAHSYWVPLEDIKAGLRYFGFKTLETGFHDPMHKNGPSIAITCMKS